jgi:hypothetical protein
MGCPKQARNGAAVEMLSRACASGGKVTSTAWRHSRSWSAKCLPVTYEASQALGGGGKRRCTKENLQRTPLWIEVYAPPLASRPLLVSLRHERQGLKYSSVQDPRAAPFSGHLARLALKDRRCDPSRKIAQAIRGAGLNSSRMVPRMSRF